MRRCCCNCRYNVRKFRHLPTHLAAAERTMNLNDDVLLNYAWLYHKCRACSFDELLLDFTLSASEDTKLVEQALQEARSYIGAAADALAPELAGRLLPFVDASPALRRLVTDCYRSGVQHCAFVPSFPYRRSRCGATRGTTFVDDRPTSYAVVGKDRRLLLVKDATSPSIQVFVYCILIIISVINTIYRQQTSVCMR